MKFSVNREVKFEGIFFVISYLRLNKLTPKITSDILGVWRFIMK